MAKAKAAATGAASKSSNDAVKKSRAAMASSTRMLVFALLGALATVMSGAFYSSFADGFNALLRFAASSAPRELEAGRYDVACADDYPVVGRCSPPPACARVIVDDFLSAKEVAVLKQMSELGMSFGQGSGGPTIFDVVSGAASSGAAFVDAYSLLSKRQSAALEASATATDEAAAAAAAATPAQIFTPLQISLYRSTTDRVKSLLESQLGVEGLYLTSPSFFSRIGSGRAVTAHDEYFHPHVDKAQYGSFAYTALLYLSEGTPASSSKSSSSAGPTPDFEGGRFEFMDTATNKTNAFAYPKPGRLMFFTSGKENTHAVSKVTSGIRHALTIAFTCDASKSVESKLLQRADDMIRKQNDAANAKTKRAEQAKQQAAAAAAAAAPTTDATPPSTV